MSDDPWKAKKKQKTKKDNPLLHLAIISIALIVVFFGEPPSGPTIKQPDSLFLQILRGFLTGVGFAYIPYFLIRIFSKTKDYAVYVSLAWVCLWFTTKFFV